MTKEEWLAQYNALSTRREELTKLFEQAGVGEIPYNVPDERAADLREVLADLADRAAEIFRAGVVVWTLTTENPNGDVSTTVVTSKDALSGAFEAALSGWVDDDDMPSAEDVRPISSMPTKRWEMLAREAGFLTVEVNRHELHHDRKLED